MATILVVDDRPVNREFFTTLLGYDHHRLLEAADGAEALALARTQRPDLVLTDILMPTMDGYELVRQLRLDQRTAHIPIVVYTAIYQQRDAQTLVHSCGRCFFLAKPSDPQEILDLVRKALSPPQSPSGQPLPEDYHSEHVRLLTDTLVRKVAELEQTVARLEWINRELVFQKSACPTPEGARQARQDLLSVIGQRLRGPLAPALESAAALEADRALPPEVRTEIGAIRRNLEMELRLIDNLRHDRSPAARPQS